MSRLITTDLDFESTLFGEPGSQSFTTVALPSEISEGDTLELTLGGLATESGTVSVSQTIDPGETLSDVATSLVADLSGLTNDAGDPLGLSGEVVTVDETGFGGVHLEDLPSRAPFRRTSLWRRRLTGGAELEVSISPSAPVSFRAGGCPGSELSHLEDLPVTHHDGSRF